jgi:hypothetical protein
LQSARPRSVSPTLLDRESKRRQPVRFVVSSEIFKLYPGLRLPVAVADDVEAAADTAGVEKLWRQAWEEAGQLVPNYGNAQSHPRVAAWREAMAATGV